MEGKKNQFSSSFTSDLFGAKDSSSTSGIFNSIFPPPPPPPPHKVIGRVSSHSSQIEKKDGSESHSWNPKTGVSEKKGPGGGGQRKGTTSKDVNSYNYQEENVQPFHYDSSIYYGGQDVYTRPKNAQNPIFNKDGEDNESGKASRGNWWEGSLYY